MSALCPRIGRLAGAVFLFTVGCVPRFESATCYGPGECGAGAICVARTCLPSTDVGIDPVDVGPTPDSRPDALDATAPDGGEPLPTIAALPFTGRMAVVPLPDSPDGTWEPLVVGSAAGGAVLLGGWRLPFGDGPSTGWLTRLDAMGQPDATFATDGWFGVGGAQRYDGIGGLVVRGDGTLLVSATDGEPGRSSWWLHALDTDGRPVTDFADGGAWRVPTFPDRLEGESAGPVALDRSGRIVFAGIASRQVGPLVTWDVALLRLTSDGELDAAFGTGGLAVRSEPGRLMTPTRILPGPRGGWTLLGTCEAHPARLCAWRVEADGRPDVTFGIAGDLRLPVPGRLSEGVGALDEHGRLWVAVARPAALARLTDDGDPDPTFGDGGWSPIGGAHVLAVAPACHGVLAVTVSEDDDALQMWFVPEGASAARQLAAPIELHHGKWTFAAATEQNQLVLIGRDANPGGLARLARLGVRCAD